MGNHFEKARRYFGDRNIKDLKYADFEDFLKTLTVGGKTKKNIMTSIRAMYVWLKKRQEIQVIPRGRPCTRPIRRLNAISQWNLMMLEAYIKGVQRLLKLTPYWHRFQLVKNSRF
jgi:hypothetical protein